MEALAAFLGGSAWLWWLAVCMVVVGVEMATGSLFLVGPALAAILMVFATLAVPGLDISIQLGLFAAISAVLTLAARGWAERWRAARQETDRPTLNKRGAELIGRHVSAAGRFDNGSGAVRVGDTQWAGRLDPPGGPPVREGDPLIVRDVDGATLIVARA